MVNGEEPYMLHYVVRDKHLAPITAIDWSRDSVYLRAIDEGYMKNYYNITKGRQVHDGHKTLSDNSIWWTINCKLGWDVNGVFPQGALGTDVHAVDVNYSKTLLAVADSQASLCVYRYPCIKNTQECLRAQGHTDHVRNVRFVEMNDDTEDSDFIITTGGTDRTFI